MIFCNCHLWSIFQENYLQIGKKEEWLQQTSQVLWKWLGLAKWQEGRMADVGHQPNSGTVRHLPTGKRYYDLVGFYPPTASFVPRLTREFPFEIQTGVTNSNYHGFPGDDRFQLLWRNPLNPKQWGFTDLDATTNFGAVRPIHIAWTTLPTLLYDQGDIAMHSYAYL